VKILSDLREKHPAITAQTPEELFELWKRGNKIPEFEAIDKVFDDMGNALGIMLANVVNTLDPQAICFAGGLTQAWKAFSRKMIQITNERSYVARHNKLRILTTSLCKNTNFMEAGVVGAASLVFVDALRKLPVEVKQQAKAPAAAPLKAVAAN
jgi:predicted NBD/HSP70 family sugar kinase